MPGGRGGMVAWKLSVKIAERKAIGWPKLAFKQ